MSAYREGESWESFIPNAGHYLAIGEEEIYLHTGDLMSYPWHLVTDVKPGGMMRYDSNVDVTCIAQHESGLQFRWSFRLEHERSNGQAGLRPDIPHIIKALALLPDAARPRFRQACGQFIQSSRTQGLESLDWATQQLGNAAALEAVLGIRTEAQP